MKLGFDELHELCGLAKVAAISTGKYIQSQIELQHQGQLKEDGDSIASRIVTEVDLAAQALILDQLRDSITKYDLGMLAEEQKDDYSRLSKDHFWSVDPLDGTLPFTEGKSGYAVTIALISKSGDPVIGVVYRPDTDKCYSAISGYGVYENDSPFTRDLTDKENVLQIYFDRSIQMEPYFDSLVSSISRWKDEDNISDIRFNYGFGSVCNAISVMISDQACYFKFPKEKKGGGCIWDYAATRLFFEELELEVSNSYGDTLHLNNPDNLFMNSVGVIFSSNLPIYQSIRALLDIFRP